MAVVRMTLQAWPEESADEQEASPVKRIVALGLVAVVLGGLAWMGGRLTAQSGAPAGADGRSRVALLNLSHVLKNYQKAVVLNNELKDLANPFQQRAKSKATQYESIVKEAQTKPDQREFYEKQLRQLKREMEDLSNETQQAMAKRQDDALVLIYKEIQDACQRVAMSQGFDMVFSYNDATTSQEYWSPMNIMRKLQQGGCTPLYFTRGMDISADVVGALNQAFGRTAPAPGAAAPAVTPVGAGASGTGAATIPATTPRP